MGTPAWHNSGPTPLAEIVNFILSTIAYLFSATLSNGITSFIDVFEVTDGLPDITPLITLSGGGLFILDMEVAPDGSVWVL